MCYHRVMEKGTIYGLRCDCGCPVNGVRYIGLTSQPLRTRLTNHRGQASLGTSTPVYNWMRKHGAANIRIVEIETVALEKLEEREIFWIANTPNLLNISPGGEGGAFRGRKRPDISERMRGSRHPGARWDEADVRELRGRYTGAYGELTRFAREYGVKVQTIEDAVKGKSWRHVH